MKGSMLPILRRTHLILSVFFSPLLLLFILTGLWQTMASDDDKEKSGWLHILIEKLSRVHTDSHFPHFGVEHGTHTGFKLLVVSMGAAFCVSILIGWVLAWRMMKQKWLVAAILLLGVLTPVLLLWFS